MSSLINSLGYSNVRLETAVLKMKEYVQKYKIVAIKCI